MKNENSKNSEQKMKSKYTQNKQINNNKATNKL